MSYCCAAVVSWSVHTAPLLLYCYVGGLVGGWVEGSGGLLGDGLLVNNEMAGGHEKMSLPEFLTVLRVLKTPEPTNVPGVPVYLRIYCCAAVLL